MLLLCSMLFGLSACADESASLLQLERKQTFRKAVTTEVKPKNDDDDKWEESLADTFGKLGGVAGGALQGKSAEEIGWEIGEVAAGVIGAALAEIPIIGGILVFFVELFHGIFGPKDDSNKKFEQFAKRMKTVMNRKLMEERIMDAEADIQGVINVIHSTSLFEKQGPQTGTRTDSKKRKGRKKGKKQSVDPEYAAKRILKMEEFKDEATEIRDKVMGACSKNYTWTPDEKEPSWREADAAACKEWQEGGMVLFATIFAQLHLSLWVHWLVFLGKENREFEGGWMRYRMHAQNYKKILSDAYEVFTDYRLRQIEYKNDFTPEKLADCAKDGSLLDQNFFAFRAPTDGFFGQFMKEDPKDHGYDYLNDTIFQGLGKHFPTHDKKFKDEINVTDKNLLKQKCEMSFKVVDVKSGALWKGCPDKLDYIQWDCEFDNTDTETDVKRRYEKTWIVIYAQAEAITMYQDHVRSHLARTKKLVDTIHIPKKYSRCLEVTKSKIKKQHKNKKWYCETIDKKLVADSLDECIIKCCENGDCGKFHYNEKTKRCHLKNFGAKKCESRKEKASWIGEVTDDF